MSKITWLHISDLHFRPSQAYDSDTVLKTLLDDVAKCVGDKGLRPDFIVLSGDVAFSSDPEEYRLAHKFLDDLLKITGLSKDRLFPVPGNHDIDHSAITNFSSQAESVLNNQDAVNSILADDQERAVIFRRFRNYEEFFIKEYMGEHITSFGNKQYHYIKRFKTADKNIAIFGLNSSWLSSSTEDCGRLLIGGNQVRAALKEAEGADLRLAVMHHPFDWLKGFDRHEVEPLLCDGCDFILHGHLHQPSLSQTVTPDTNAMIIAAGACYETRRSHNSYNFVQLDLSTHKGTIYFRMYSYNQGGFWTEDTATYRNVKNGMYHFDLPDHFCHLPDGSTRCRISKAPFTAIFQAPPLPQHFVPRPEKSNEIKQHLLNCNSDRLVISALHGLGGIGKTILAAALAHDEDVRKHFSDGILWVTLGQDPDLLSLLGGWIQALGDYKFHPTTPEVASAHLRTLLYDKTALIVVDDVWEFEHVSAFLVGGPSCQMLITTRRAHIADDVNAKLYELNLMTREQCLNLFSARLGKILDKSESNVALDVAESVGRLPLALELAAVRIKRGGSWERLRQALEQEIAQLNYLQGTRRRLEASLNLSFKALYSCNEDLWRKFILLGILPEDAKINASMATTLWNVSETDAEQMLELLWEEALLIRDSPTKSNGQYLEIYRLHDLLHDYALHFVIAPVIPKKSDLPGLGLLLPEANACFLERYQKKTKNSQWHTLPNDSYVHEHLFWHMQKADRIEEINALLQEETPDDKNGWYQVRERLGQTGGFIENVSHAWKLTEKESESRIETGDIAPMVGLETLYALIIASVKNLVSNISPGLLIVLVKKGVWTPKQGMSCALQVPDLKQRDEALKQLSLSLQDPQEALDVAREIRDEDSSAVALAGIVPNLPEPQKTSVLNEAITMARQIEDEDLRAKTLAVIAPKIPRIDGALSVIREIKDELEKMRALIEIASNLSETKEAIAMVWEIKDENLRSRMLVEIAPILTDPDPKDIIDTVKKGIEDRQRRDNTLAKIARSLPKLQDTYDVAWGIDNNPLRMQVLREIDSKKCKFQKTDHKSSIMKKHMSNLIRGKIDQGAQREGEPETTKYMSNIWRNIIDKRPQHESEPEITKMKEIKKIEEALTAARQIKDEDLRDRTLSKIAPKIPEIQDACAVIKQIKDECLKVEALVEMSTMHLEPEKTTILNEALAVARDAKDELLRARAFVEIAPKLSGMLKERVIKETLVMVRQINNKESKSRLLAKIAIESSEIQKAVILNEALAVAGEIEDMHLREKVMDDLRAEIPKTDETLLVDSEIGDECLRTSVFDDTEPNQSDIANILAKLPPSELYPLWQEILHNSAQSTRSDLLSDLGDLVPVILALGGQEALKETARAIQDVGRWWP